jgi:hypothetical protein
LDEIDLSNQKNLVSNNQQLSRLYLSKIFRKKQDLTVDVLVNTVWVSTFLALMLTVPSLVIFIGIYFSTGNLLLAVVSGFGLTL